MIDIFIKLLLTLLQFSLQNYQSCNAAPANGLLLLLLVLIANAKKKIVVNTNFHFGHFSD